MGHMVWDCPKCEYSSEVLGHYSVHFAKAHDAGNAFVAHEGEDRLRELYEKHSRREIARQYDVTVKVITNALKSIDIELRSHEESVEKYHNEHSIQEIDKNREPYLTHHSDGYEEIRYRGNRIYVHRLAAVAWFGLDAVVGSHIHHKNNIPWDNREKNVEPLSESEHRSHHTSEMWEKGYGVADR